MDRLIQRLTRLAAAFPRDGATEATLAVYAEELCNLDEDTICTAIDTVTRSSTRFPPLTAILSEYHEERERQWERMRRESFVPALPMGRDPMPDAVRESLRQLGIIFDKKAKEMDPE